LCYAVRDVIAPAVAGLVSQDRLIAHDYELLDDMGHDGDRFTLDNIHLGIDVYHLAAKNIKIHQALDQLAVLRTDDSQVAADVARLRVKLLDVADAQAGTLNVMSEISQSDDLAEGWKWRSGDDQW
jgi:hypothetical protein